MFPRRRYVPNNYDQTVSLLQSDSFVDGAQAATNLAPSTSESQFNQEVTLPITNPAEEMACHDRTGEFLAITRLAQQHVVQPPTMNGSYNDKLQQKTRFTKLAAKLGQDLTQTLTKIEQLTLLVKKKSLYDDKSEQIQELIGIIKMDIGGLTKGVVALQEASAQNSGRNHARNHSEAVIKIMQSKLGSMAGQFKQVLNQRTETLKEQNMRRNQFSSSANLGQLDYAFEDESSTSDSTALLPMKTQSTIHKDGNLAYLTDRAKAMESIETTIVEMGEIFKNLAFMVKEQEEMVVSIDNNVEDTATHVDLAHREIVKYFQSVSSNRWLMIKIFGVLLTFFIIFVAFMS